MEQRNLLAQRNSGSRNPSRGGLTTAAQGSLKRVEV